MSEKGEQLARLRRQAMQAADPHVRPYLSSVAASKWLQVPDLRGYWNCGVKAAYRKLADFDAASQLKRVSQVLRDQLSNVKQEQK